MNLQEANDRDMKIFNAQLRREFWERCVVAMITGRSANEIDTHVTARGADNLSAEWGARYSVDAVDVVPDTEGPQ